MSYMKFVNKITGANIVYAAVLIILGLIKTGNWMADASYLICGGTQLLFSVLIPLRMGNMEKENNDLALAEIFVQQNWVILALGMGGACSYLAPFIAPVTHPAFAYVAFAAGIATLLTGIYSMIVTRKKTGIDLMV